MTWSTRVFEVGSKVKVRIGRDADTRWVATATVVGYWPASPGGFSTYALYFAHNKELHHPPKECVDPQFGILIPGSYRLVYADALVRCLER